MSAPTAPGFDELVHNVRLHLFGETARTGRVPQAPAIADALGQPETEIRSALRQLAASRVIVLAPNEGNIWIAAPFCAVPSAFRVVSNDTTYWGICIWDALGIPAALGSDAVITTRCAESGEPMRFEVRNQALAQGEGVIHFAVPANRWWDNIGFT
jgi:hypothetical protein